MYTGFKSGTKKTDISNCVPVFICYNYTSENEGAIKEFVYKCIFSNQSIGTFKLRLHNINWREVRQWRDANEA